MINLAGIRLHSVTRLLTCVFNLFLPSGGFHWAPHGCRAWVMGRHTADRGPANDAFMTTVVGALLLVVTIILMLAAN